MIDEVEDIYAEKVKLAFNISRSTTKSRQLEDLCIYLLMVSGSLCVNCQRSVKDFSKPWESYHSSNIESELVLKV